MCSKPMVAGFWVYGMLWDINKACRKIMVLPRGSQGVAGCSPRDALFATVKLPRTRRSPEPSVSVLQIKSVFNNGAPRADSSIASNSRTTNDQQIYNQRSDKFTLIYTRQVSKQITNKCNAQ